MLRVLPREARTEQRADPLTLLSFTPEQIRQRHLERVRVVGSLTEDRFDRLAHLAVTIFGVPMSSVTLADGGRVVSNSVRALDIGPSTEDALWARAGNTRTGVLISDASADARFADLPAVIGTPYLRFFAGIPLVDDDGVVLGTFSLYDSVPRRLDATQWATFVELASWVRRELVDSEEMARARLVQESLLPGSAPVVAGYQVAGVCLPTKSVGGDFYDFTVLPGRLVISLVDVMGKGTGAALVAATFRALLHASMSEVALGVGGRQAGDLRRPIRGGFGGVLADIDRLIGRDLEHTGTLVTGFFCGVEPDTGLVHYADAGHGLTVLLRNDGTASWLTSADLPVGVETVGSWTEHEVSLHAGDTLLSVSDGLLDLFGGAGQALADIAQLARDHPGADDLVGEIHRLARLGTAVDDVTAVAIHREMTV